MTGWQDISTAPKDGSDILVFGGTCETTMSDYDWENQRIRVAFWDGSFWNAGYAERYDEEYMVTPTHWHPIPEPPQ